MNRNKLIRIFYPERCPRCHEIVPLEYDFCQKCFPDTRIEKIPLSTCEHCGCAEDKCICGRSLNTFEHLQGVYYYLGAVRAKLQSLKFNGCVGYAKSFGKEMAQRFREVYPDAKIDAVTFVPMTPADEKQRGFNQSELLCDAVGKELKALSIELLIKTRQTRKQHELTAAERQNNLEKCFFVTDEDDIRDRNIILVDDIKTTGATLSACIEKLKAAGANEVYCLVAAVTKMEKLDF